MIPPAKYDVCARPQVFQLKCLIGHSMKLKVFEAKEPPDGRILPAPNALPSRVSSCLAAEKVAKYQTISNLWSIMKLFYYI